MLPQLLYTAQGPRVKEQKKWVRLNTVNFVQKIASDGETAIHFFKNPIKALSQFREKYVDPIIFEQPALSVMEKLKSLHAINRVRHDREDPIYGLERAVNDPAIDLALFAERLKRSRHYPFTKRLQYLDNILETSSEIYSGMPHRYSQQVLIHLALQLNQSIGNVDLQHRYLIDFKDAVDGFRMKSEARDYGIVGKQSANPHALTIFSYQKESQTPSELMLNAFAMGHKSIAIYSSDRLSISERIELKKSAEKLNIHFNILKENPNIKMISEFPQIIPKIHPVKKYYLYSLNDFAGNFALIGLSVVTALGFYGLWSQLFLNPTILMLWGMMTFGRLISTDLLAKNGTPRYWNKFSFKNIEFNKMSLHLSLSFISIIPLQTIGAISTYFAPSLLGSAFPHLVNYFPTAMVALGNGIWLFSTYRWLGENLKVSLHNAGRSIYGFCLASSFIFGIESLAPYLVESLAAAIKLFIATQPLILNKICSEIVAFVIHYVDPGHRKKRRELIQKLKEKLFPGIFGEDKSKFRKHIAALIYFWAETPYARAAISRALIRRNTLEELKESKEIIEQMETLSKNKKKLIAAIGTIKSPRGLKSNAALEMFISKHPNYAHEPEYERIELFKDSSDPSPEEMQELHDCYPRDRASKKKLNILFSKWRHSYRNPKKIYRIIDTYCPDFHSWVKKKLPKRLKRREVVLKIKLRISNMLNKTFGPFKQIFNFLRIRW